MAVADPADDRAPHCILWRFTSRATARNRAERYRRFIEVAQPGRDSRILDVGVIDSAWRSGNFLESSYPWPANITAVSLDDVPTFRELFPEVRLVVADGRSLPFKDREFDIGFSNAVVEHVGTRAQQRQFIGELLRTCRLVFVSTPNAWFPVDPHTLLPFVHWLPRRIRHPILRATGNGFWARVEALNPLSVRDFRGLFPAGTEVTVIRQRVIGLTTVATVVARGR